MSVILDKHTIEIALKLGLKSVGEYAAFIVDLNNL